MEQALSPHCENFTATGCSSCMMVLDLVGWPNFNLGLRNNGGKWWIGRFIHQTSIPLSIIGNRSRARYRIVKLTSVR